MYYTQYFCTPPYNIFNPSGRPYNIFNCSYMCDLTVILTVSKLPFETAIELIF